MTRDFAKPLLSEKNEEKSKWVPQVSSFKFNIWTLTRSNYFQHRIAWLSSNSYPNALVLIIFWHFQTTLFKGVDIIYETRCSSINLQSQLPDTVAGRFLKPSSWKRVWAPYLFYCVCLCNWGWGVYGWRLEANWQKSILPYEYWGWSSGHQAWWTTSSACHLFFFWQSHCNLNTSFQLDWLSSELPGFACLSVHYGY